MIGWIGIDPGATGALAVIWVTGKVEILDWPGDERALLRMLDSLDHYDAKFHTQIQWVVLEYQQAMPKQGVSSTFKLGMNYGMWLSAIADQGWPLEIVRPTEWKKGWGYPAKDKTGGKEHSLTLARQLYPQAAGLLARKKDHNRAEALLLAHIAKGGKA